MAFFPFEMERMMSRFEQAVDYNLSESGVHPVLLSEMCGYDPGLMDRLLATDLARRQPDARIRRRFLSVRRNHVKQPGRDQRRR